MDSELEFCEHLQFLVLAKNDDVRRNQTGLDAIHINGNWGLTTNGDETDNDCFHPRQRSFGQQRSLEQTQRVSHGGGCCVANNQRRSEVHGRDYGRLERRRIPEDISEASMCVIPGDMCVIPGRDETCVSDNYAPLRGEV